MIPMDGEDVAAGAAFFPAGALDANSQPIDLRTKNTWRLKAAEVSTVEVAEVMMINTIAPFTITARLQSLLEKSGPMAFVVQVSSMEGCFEHFKTPFHPHTNMAKAGLNMFVRTAGPDMASAGVFMTAVDTGWVNDENPINIARDKFVKTGFQTPLDEIDGAARVLDPVFSAVSGGEALHSVLLKDYQIKEW